MNNLGNVKEWAVVKKWRFILLALGVALLNILTQKAVFSLPNLEDNYLWIGASLLLLATGIGCWIAYRSGLWQEGKRWRVLEAIGFIAIGTIVLFGVKMLGSQLVMLEEGVGKTTANQEIIQNSGMPNLILFVFAVLFAPVLEELFFRGLIMGKIFGKASILGLLLSSFFFGWVHGPTNIGSWVIYAGMGLVLGVIYRISGNFSYVVLIHLINNLIGVLLILLLQSLGLM